MTGQGDLSGHEVAGVLFCPKIMIFFPAVL